MLLVAESLNHPLSLDVFENHLFFTTRIGELVKQDKFGRGIPVVMAKDLVNPTGVKGKCVLGFDILVSRLKGFFIGSVLSKGKMILG